MIGHTGAVTGCAFGTRQDGTLLLASTSEDLTVRLWDPGTGAPVGDPLTGHTRQVTGCAFGTRPDGTLLLATTSFDETVRLWDPTTGTPVGNPLTGHTDEVYRVRVRHPLGRNSAARHHELRPHGAAVGPGHRRRDRGPADRPHRRGVRVRVRHPPGRNPAAGHHE